MTRVALLCALLLLPITVQAQSAQDLFPNHMGNSWTFDVTGSLGSSSRTMEVDRRAGGWAHVTGFEGDRWWWISSQSGKIWTWNATAGTYTQVFDLGVVHLQGRSELGYRFPHFRVLVEEADHVGDVLQLERLPRLLPHIAVGAIMDHNLPPRLAWSMAVDSMVRSRS